MHTNRIDRCKKKRIEFVEPDYGLVLKIERRSKILVVLDRVREYNVEQR